MGTSKATRDTRFFSAASRLGSRLGEPSPTSTTPGLPTARCTTSMLRLADTAGVIVQPPRMLCRIAAAAPGWPSTALYWADWAYRPKMIIATIAPLSTPSGISSAAVPVSRPTTTKIASTPIPARATSGSARGLVLRMIPATMRICLMRPAAAGSAPSFRFAAPAGFFAMDGRIRAAGGCGKPPPGGYPVTAPTARPAPARAASAGAGSAWARTGHGGTGRGGISRVPARHRLGVQPARAVGGPDQRPGHHAREAEAECLLAEPLELGRLHPPGHRVMARGRAQVLGDGEQFAPGGPQVGHGLADLGWLLAQAEDEVGLRDQARGPGLRQYLERPAVPEAGPDLPEDARHGLDVVGQHLRAGGEYLAQPRRVGVEVGDQKLDPAAGHGRVDLGTRLCVQPGAAVGQVVACHAGDGRIAQAHLRHGRGDPARFVGVERIGFPGGDLAEVAPPGARVAADQERRLPVLPAFKDVGAARLLAHGMQAPASHQALQLAIFRAGPQPDLDPRRLTLDGRLAVAGLETEQPAAFGCEYHGSRVRPWARGCR